MRKTSSLMRGDGRGSDQNTSAIAPESLSCRINRALPTGVALKKDRSVANAQANALDHARSRLLSRGSTRTIGTVTVAPLEAELAAAACIASRRAPPLIGARGVLNPTAS